MPLLTSVISNNNSRNLIHVAFDDDKETFLTCPEDQLFLIA